MDNKHVEFNVFDFFPNVYYIYGCSGDGVFLYFSLEIVYFSVEAPCIQCINNMQQFDNFLCYRQITVCYLFSDGGGGNSSCSSSNRQLSIKLCGSGKITQK